MGATPVPAPAPWWNRQPVRGRQAWRRWGRLASAALCLLPLAGLAAEPRPVTRGCPAPNEWAGPRGNPTLDARSPLKGRITAPRLAWKQGVGAVETRLIIAPGPDSRPFPLPAPGASTQPVDVGAADWGLTPLSATLSDQTHPAGRTHNTTYADVLPDTPGLERLDFESGFDKPTVNGQWQPCAGRCSAWRNGAWQKAWETAPIELLFQALPLVGDFDADQAPEVAILPWYELLILDARTGAVKDRCRFTPGRSYGFFGSYDLDGDGRSEFVVQADFAKHIDVLGYRDGKLALLWQREIELDIANPQKILRVHPDPVADVDGDGRQEALFTQGNTLTCLGTLPDAAQGAVRWTFALPATVGPPAIAAVDGSGEAVILLVGADGYVYAVR